MISLDRSCWVRTLAFLVVVTTLIASGLGCGDDAADPTGLAPCDPAGTISFGSVEIGESADSTWIITNATPDILAGTVTSECDEFSIVDGYGEYSLAPDESRAVTIRFAPTSEGNKSCTIRTGVDCADLRATGSGVAPPAVCELSLPLNVLDFGDLPVGFTSIRTFTISNAGPPGSRLVGRVRFKTNYGGFQFLSGGGSYSLAPGEIHEVKVQLTHREGLNSCNIETGCGEVWGVGSGH